MRIDSVSKGNLKGAKDYLTRVGAESAIRILASLLDEVEKLIRCVPAAVFYLPICNFEAMIAAESIEPMLCGQVASIPCTCSSAIK